MGVDGFFGFGVAVFFVEAGVLRGPRGGHGLPALGGERVFDVLEGAAADGLFAVGEVDEDGTEVVPVGFGKVPADDECADEGVVREDFVDDTGSQPFAEPVAGGKTWRVFWGGAQVSVGVVVKGADHDIG